MKKMNDLFGFGLPQTRSKTDLNPTNEILGLQSSIIGKNNQILQKGRKLSVTNSSLFSDRLAPLFSDSIEQKPNKPTHKFNQSLITLRSSIGVPSLSKSKVISPESNNNNDIYSNNSRLREINALIEENKILKRELALRKKELAEVDEFKMMMRNCDATKNCNEKRVQCLKGQLHKQQKYIKKLEKTFKLMKIFHDDSRNLITLFIDISSKYQDKFRARQKPKFSKSNEETLQRLDSDSFKDSVEKMMKNFKNPDSFKEFIDQFNSAYKLILNYERSNEEFNRVFRQTKNNNETNRLDFTPILEYQNPITTFVERYKRYFNIKTVFDVIVPNEKDIFTNNFENLLSLNSKIEMMFHKLNTIDIFKNNDFYISNKSAPFISEKNHENFVDFLVKNTQTHFLGMNYQEIMDLESRLANLLNDIIVFEYDFIYQKDEINLNKVNNIKEKLRSNIDKLIELGVRLSDTEDANLLYVLEKDIQNERESAKNNGKNDTHLLIAEKSEEVKRDFKNCCIYIKEFMINLPEIVLQDPVQQPKIKKMDFLVDILTSIFEEKEVLSQILELDLRKQKETLEILNDGLTEIQIFFEQKNNSFNKFYSEMREKIIELSSTIEALADDKNNPFFKRMKRKFDEIFQFFSKIPFENPSEKRMKMKRMLEEYELKFKELYSKWLFFQNSIEKIKSNL